ncbi:MAG: urease accessory protein UreD [Pseudomonadota bacterium]
MTPATSNSHAQRMQRAIGSARLQTMHVDARTRIADLYQHANAKIRVPKHHGAALEAVLINTAGGLTGGDILNWSLIAGPKTRTVVSTQACERIYKSAHGAAQVSTKLDIGDDAHLLWLPQETILFEGASLQRSLEADLHPTGRLTAMETIVMGREAMAETISQLHFNDRWMVTADDKPVHADAIRIDQNALAGLAEQARLGDHRVFGTLVDIQPSRAPMETQDRQRLVDKMHQTFDDDPSLNLGVSVLGAKTILRFTARTSYDLRQRLPDLLKEMVPNYRLPAVWRL